MNSKTQSTSLFPIKLLTVTAMFTAMNILLSSIGIPVPGGHLYLNDVVICTAAILLNPFCAFFVGGVGAFLGDFFFYPTPMFVSLVTHGLQAVVISLIAYRKGSQPKTARAIIAVAAGAVIMIAGYSFGRAFIYATPAAAIAKLPYQILQAAVGAVSSVVLIFPLKLGKLYRKIIGV